MDSAIEVPTPYGYQIPALVGDSGKDLTGTVIMAHGIFSSKDENGRYPRQAQLHQSNGRRTLRFDWQGHGDHPVPFAESTIAGNIDDLQSIIDYAARTWNDDLYIVASSFGGSIFLLHAMLGRGKEFKKAVLLNPVTDYRSSFYIPSKGELQVEFSAAVWNEVFTAGRGSDENLMSRRLAIELLTLEPFRGFDYLRTPTLVLHGTSDSSVSHDITKLNAERGAAITFRSVDGAEHAFAEPWAEEFTFNAIMDWFA